LNEAARPGRSRPRLNWKAWVGIALSIVLLWYALREVDPREVISEIGHADPILFLLSVFFATAVFAIRAWRWRTLLIETAPNSSFRSRYAATTIGFMGNNLLPARVGEFARAYAFSRMENITVVASFGSLVIERLLDALAIVTLLFVVMAVPSVPDLSNLGGRDLSAVAVTLAIFVGLALALGSALVVFPQRTVSFVERYIARFIPRPIRRPIVDSLEAFLSGMNVLRSPWLLSTALVQTAVLWLFNAVGFWLAFKAFGIEADFAAALLLQSVIALAVSIPSGPGFFGPFEAAAKFVLVQGYGITQNKAISFAIGFHIGGFIPVTVIGLYYAWRLGITLRDVEQSEEVVEDAVEETMPNRP
jgi:glycosyltransferase 2 family protein